MNELIYRIWDFDDSTGMLVRSREFLAPYRELWDEIFADPEGFADYYFQEVCKNNIIIGVYEADTLIGMAYANPYLIADAETSSMEQSYYIVGVAVATAYRRQGIMREMLQRLMKHLHDKGCRFVFLMPENEAYYSSFGFGKIYDTKTITIETASFEFEMPIDPTVKVLHLSRLPEEEWQLLAKGINKELAKQYKYYVNRNETVLRSMLQEHQCQKGDVAIVYDNEHVRGIFAYGRAGKQMYIERFELFDEAYIDMLAKVLVRVAAFMKCDTCSVTFDARYTKHFAEAFRGACVIEEGHGIMAYSLDNLAFSIENLKNKSFFDEIV